MLNVLTLTQKHFILCIRKTLWFTFTNTVECFQVVKPLIRLIINFLSLKLGSFGSRFGDEMLSSVVNKAGR